MKMLMFLSKCCFPICHAIFFTHDATIIQNGIGEISLQVSLGLSVSVGLIGSWKGLKALFLDVEDLIFFP